MKDGGSGITADSITVDMILQPNQAAGLRIPRWRPSESALCPHSHGI